MRLQIESQLIKRDSKGNKDHYDCPKCIQKDPTGNLVIEWDKEVFICNHGNSCGWQGHVSELARFLNIDIPRERPQRANYKKEVKKVYKLKEIVPHNVVLPDNNTLEVDEIARIQHLEALFGHSDQLVVCIDSNYANPIKSDQGALEYSSENYTHVKVNHGGSKAEDVVDFKYTLIECDDIADLSIQRGYIESLSLPVASLVWSGNKSLHAVVKVNAPNIGEYKRRLGLLHEVCTSVGFKIDTSTKDPCRFTRLAGGINTATGRQQKLIQLHFGANDWNEWENNILPRFVVSKNVVNSSSIESKRIESGFSSGFLTFDYNDSGLKDSTLCLLTGRRGQGKTTFARQMLIASARQSKKCFAWFGEGDKEVEKGYLVRLIANQAELVPYDNGYGRTLWDVEQSAVDRYNSGLGKNIDLYVKPLRMDVPVFEDLMSRMIDKARLGCKFFLVDNMMKLTVDQLDTFKAQQQIVSRLKEFVDNFKVYVCIICHPKAGEGDQKISGAQEQENTADTILRFKRTMSLSEKELHNDFPHSELRNVTAMVTVEKVRNGGKEYPMYMEFDGVKQANMEITYIDKIRDDANDYRNTGYYSRPAKDICL